MYIIKNTKWKIESPEAKFFLRLKEDLDENEPSIENIGNSNSDVVENYSDIFDEENTRMLFGSRKKILYVHQTNWQRRLMQRYGNEICLLDATYRTTKYTLPLFFACVPTNVNYMVIASFILETEDSASIQEALQIVRSWNPDWRPRFFMCDHADEEIKALERVFPDSFVYLCDFHREQAWERWTNNACNGVSQNKHEILRLLRDIAKASTENEYIQSRDLLMGSKVWAESSKFQNWFSRTWLTKHKRWVSAFRQNRFVVSVNTTNGVERQHKSLKYEYLASKKARSLSHLLQVINQFLNTSYIGYLKLNVAGSEQVRSYDSKIPSFMVNRPKHFVAHCLKRWQDSEMIERADVDEFADGIFLVKSQSQPDILFEVRFSNPESNLPSCQCKDWKNSHLPCKHFMAVFRHFPDWGFHCLPEPYISSPFLCLDIQKHQESQVEGPPTDDESCIENVVIGNSESVNASNNIINQLPTRYSLKKIRGKIIHHCQLLKDWVHQCKDLKRLKILENDLFQQVTSLRSILPKDGSFLVNVDDPVPRQKKQRKRSNKKVISIQKKNIRKPGVGRHGIGAYNKRNAYTNKGVQELAATDLKHSVDSDVIEEIVTDIETNDETMLSENNGREENPMQLTTNTTLLSILKNYMSGLSIEAWQYLLRKAKSTRGCEMTEEKNRGAAVLETDTSTVEPDYVAAVKEAVPQNICFDTALNLLLILASNLATEGLVKIDIDPADTSRKINECMNNLCNISSLDAEYRSPCKRLSQDILESDEIKRAKVYKRGKSNTSVCKTVEKINFNIKPLPFQKNSGKLEGGLINPIGKNLCFANALLQCLRLTEMHQILEKHQNCCVSDENCFVCCLKEFFKEGPASAEYLCSKMKSFWKEYSVGQQQDCHELLSKIMAEVHDKCSVFGDGSRNIFWGSQINTITCLKCGNETSNVEPFFDISVSIQKVQSTGQALSRHFENEEVNYFCVLCKQNTKAKKHTKLSVIPKIIAIHLKRFNASGKKLLNHLEIDMDISFREFVAENEILHDKAELFGVILHCGKQIFQGHYYAMVHFAGHWYKLDDLKVKRVNRIRWKDCVGQPYILFYRTLQRPYIS